jgi:trimethylamine corrinoid protein
MDEIPADTLQLSHELETALLSLDRLKAQAVLHQSTTNLETMQRIEWVIVPALERIGEGWEAGTVALSQIYMSGRLCVELVDEILPPSDPRRKNQPKMAIAVLEDHHALGKRIVYAALRAAGYELADYGQGIGVEDLVARVLRDQVRFLLISTLMLRSALQIKTVVTQLRTAGANTRVIVGGAPFLFDADLWRSIGAEAMGRNASEAIQIVRRLAGETA